MRSDVCIESVSDLRMNCVCRHVVPSVAFGFDTLVLSLFANVLGRIGRISSPDLAQRRRTSLMILDARLGLASLDARLS